MKNFRPDKKLERKRAWKWWRKTRNTLKDWLREESNRAEAGLPHRNPPVEFAQRRKYPIRGITPAKRRELMYKSLKEAQEKAAKQKQEVVVKLKWYQKLWLTILKWLKKK